MYCRELLRNCIDKVRCNPSKAEFFGDIVGIRGVDHPKEGLDAVVAELGNPIYVVENHIDVIRNGVITLCLNLCRGERVVEIA